MTAALTFQYEVTYRTVNGFYGIPTHTLAEARADVRRLKQLIKQPGHAAWGIKIVKVA